MSKKSESPKTQTDAKESKAKQSSYWLTPEEIKALHEDAQRTMELIRQLRKKKGSISDRIPGTYNDWARSGEIRKN